MNDRPVVLITAPFDDAAAQRLAGAFEVVRVEPSLAGASLASMGLDDELSRATAIVAELDAVDRATLDLAPDLRLVVSCRANPVNVDLDACSARGIPVATTPGRNAEVTADLAFALVLSTVRHVSRSERWLRDGSWSSDDVFEPYERFKSVGLGGRTIGILGGGAVGRRVLRRALGFGMRAKVYDPFLSDGAFGDDAEIVALDEAMACDVVTVHVPLTPATAGMIGAAELAHMHPDAFLINAGRAAIIDEDALMEVLREHRIAGAGFDVFHQEPLPGDHELLRLDNVTLTPHIAGASDDVVGEHSRMAADALLAWSAGERPRAVANAEALEARSVSR